MAVKRLISAICTKEADLAPPCREIWFKKVSWLRIMTPFWMFSKSVPGEVDAQLFNVAARLDVWLMSEMSSREQPIMESI
jgi:hypothetical protein